MPKYWVKNYFAHGRCPKVGQKQNKEGEKNKKRNVGNNNGQAMHGARKHAWSTQTAWANTKGSVCLHIGLGSLRGGVASVSGHSLQILFSSFFFFSSVCCSERVVRGAEVIMFRPGSYMGCWRVARGDKVFRTGS